MMNKHINNSFIFKLVISVCYIVFLGAIGTPIYALTCPTPVSTAAAGFSGTDAAGNNVNYGVLNPTTSVTIDYDTTFIDYDDRLIDCQINATSYDIDLNSDGSAIGSASVYFLEYFTWGTFYMSIEITDQFSYKSLTTSLKSEDGTDLMALAELGSFQIDGVTYDDIRNYVLSGNYLAQEIIYNYEVIKYLDQIDGNAKLTFEINQLGIIIDNYDSSDDSMDFSFDDSNLTFYLLIEDMSSDDSAEFFGDFTIDSSNNLVGSAYLIEDTNKTTPLITVTSCQFAGMSFYDIESATYLSNGCNL